MAEAVLNDSISLEAAVRKYRNGPYPNLAYQSVPVRIKDLLSFRSAFDQALPDDADIRKAANNSPPFYLRQLDEACDKKQFLAALKTVRVDTLPGTVYRYNNLNLELAAFVLERVDHRSFESLLQEHILSDLDMKATKMQIEKTDVLANGDNVKKEKITCSNLLSTKWTGQCPPERLQYRCNSRPEPGIEHSLILP